MTPSLDLEKSVSAWRAEITVKDPLRVADLEELEAHLRDVFADLRTRGLTDGEAFYLARRRTGGAEVIEEFTKVNPDTVWAERGKWMVFGVLAFEVFWSALRTGFSAIDLAINQLNLGRTGFLTGYWLTTLGALGLFGGALACLVRGKWRLGRIERFSALRHPAVLAVLVGLMFLVEKALEGIRSSALFAALQSYGYRDVFMTSAWLRFGLAFGTLLLVAIASAFADRGSRRAA